MKKFLSLVLALVMTMSLVTVSAGAEDFTDDSKITYKEAVDVMSAVNVIDGYTDGSFQPTTNLTRGAAAKIICNLILGPTTASALGADTAPYSDVPVSNVFSGYIAYCQKEGIISGYADGTFRPSAPLTGYAFMKMLLGALGYDSAKEGYTGANWSVNVAKQAIAIGLNKGNDEFVGQATVNREEAMLYAFNTMKADLVEYGNETTITVGDVTVSQSGKAQSVTWGNSADKVNNIKKDEYVQFAERYFSDLKLVEGTDDFARPSNIWYFKADKVGTYAKTPDVTYSKNVELGDIYKDLGMSVKDTAEVYINGVEGDSALVSKANKTKIADDGQNEDLVNQGSTVEVYRNEDNNDVTICVIDTYVGTIAKTVEAKGNKDRYVVVVDEGNKVANFEEEYTTEEEFDDDTVVLFTYSQSAEAIKSVVAAESVEGTLTKKVAGKSFTLGDTVYPFAIQLSFDGLTYGSMTTKSDYTFYLDTYGNVIYVVEEEFVPEDYAKILAIGDAEGFYTDRVKVVTGSGTVKTYETDKDYTHTTPAFEQNEVVTFKLDDDNVATLRKVAGVIVGSAAHNTGDNFVMESGKAQIKYNDGTETQYLYANSKTVFVVKDSNGDYKSYTGINSAPSIKPAAGESVSFDAYCRTSGLVTVMFIDASNTTSVYESKNIIFLAGESQSKLITDADGDYYEYNAVVKGEIVEGFKVAVNGVDNVNNSNYEKDASDNFLFNGASYDKYNIAISFSGFQNASDTYKYVGTVKLSGEYTIGFGTDAEDPDIRYTVADDAKIYKIDEDGVITEVALNSVKTDANDRAMVVVDDGQIAYLFVQEVDGDEIEAPEYGETDSRLGVKVDLFNGKIEFLISGEDFTMAEKIAAVKNAIAEEYGCAAEDVKVVTNGYDWTVSAPGLDGTTCEVTNIVNAITVADRDTHRAYAADVVKAFGEKYQWCVDLNNSNFVTYDATITTTAKDEITVSGKVKGFDVETKDVPGFTEAGHSIAQDQTQLANATEFAIIAFYDNAGAAWYSIVGNGSYEGPATVELNGTTYTINWDLTW